LTSVSCVNVSACVAVDANGGYVIFHNNSWTTVSYADPLNDIVGVACNSQPACVLVDQSNRGASVGF
jgi:hypothetical protein